MSYETTISVAGVRFEGRQKMLESVYDDFWLERREDEVEIALEAEPDNKYDRNAVKVLVVGPKSIAGHVGYVPRDEAEFVGQAWKDGRVEEVVLAKMGVNRQGVWAKIKLKLMDEDDTPESPDLDLIEDVEGRTYEFEN